MKAGVRAMRLPLFALAVLLCAASAEADLYRWIDPETGSVKFSSYPPPWYGDAEKEKRAPRVEHIPPRRPAAAPGTPVSVPGPSGLPGAATPPGTAGLSVQALEEQRKRLMQELASPAARKDLQAGTLRKQLESFAVVGAQLDQLDPAGAEKRRAEAQPVLEKLVQGLSAQPKSPPGSR